MSLHIELSDVPSLLRHISSDDRDTWYKVGNGLKTEFGDSAFADWNQWSQQADNYNRDDAISVWKSLQSGKNTLGTVIFWAQQGGWIPSKKDLSPAEKRKLKEEQEARRATREAEIEANAVKKAKMQKAVAKGCQKLWENYGIEFGQSDYLKTKGVTGLGIRYFHQSVMLWIDDENEKTGVVSGSKVFEFFKKQPKPRPDNIHFLLFKRGTIAIPLRDENNQLWSLQAINSTGTKLFPKHSRKAGCYHVIGVLTGAKVVAIAEGYATAASIHMATDWPVVVAFDAGNIINVAPHIRQQCPDAKILICADRDENGKGQTKAAEAAALIGANVVLPNFGGTA